MRSDLNREEVFQRAAPLKWRPYSADDEPCGPGMYGWFENQSCGELVYAGKGACVLGRARLPRSRRGVAAWENRFAGASNTFAGETCRQGRW